MSNIFKNRKAYQNVIDTNGFRIEAKHRSSSLSSRSSPSSLMSSIDPQRLHHHQITNVSKQSDPQSFMDTRPHSYLYHHQNHSNISNRSFSFSKHFILVSLFLIILNVIISQQQPHHRQFRSRNNSSDTSLFRNPFDQEQYRNNISQTNSTRFITKMMKTTDFNNKNSKNNNNNNNNGGNDRQRSWTTASTVENVSRKKKKEMKNLSASSSLPSNLKKFSDLNVDLVFEDSVDVGTKHYNDSYDYYSDIDDVDDEKSVRGQHRNGEIRVAVPFDSSTNDKPVVVPYPVMQQSSITLQNPLTDRSFRRESIDSDQSEQKNSVSNISISPAPSHHQSSNSRDHRNNDDHKRGKVLYEYSESMNEIQQKSQQRYREPTVIVSSKPIYMRNEADLHHLSRPTRTKKMTTSKATNAVRMIEQGDYHRPISSMPFPSSSHQREPQQQKQRHLFDLKSSNHSSFDRDLEKNSIPKNSNNNEQRSIKISLVERNRFDPISNHIDVTKQLQTLESEDHILRPFRRRNEKIVINQDCSKTMTTTNNCRSSIHLNNFHRNEFYPINSDNRTYVDVIEDDDNGETNDGDDDDEEENGDRTRYSQQNLNSSNNNNNNNNYNQHQHLDHREQNRNFAANNYPWQLPMIELKRLTRTEETSMQNHSVLENRFDDRKKIVQPTIFINELDEREHLFRKRLPLLSNDEGFILTTIHNNVHNRTNSNSNNNNNAANQSIVNSSQNHQEISGSKEFHTNQNNLNLPVNVANNHHHINNNLNGRNNNQNEFNRRFGDLPVPPSSLLKPLPPPLFPNKPHNHHHHPHHHHHLQARAFDFNHSPMIPSLTPPSSIIPPSSMLFQKPNIGTREDVISLNDLESDDEFKTTARNNNNKIPDNADNSNEKNQLKAMLMNPLYNPNLPPFDRLPTGLQDLMPLFFDKFMAQLANGPQKQFLTNSSPMNSIERDITDLDEPNPMERQVVGNKPLSKPSMKSSPPPKSTTSTIRFVNEIIPTGNEFDAEFGNFNSIENVPNNGGEWPKIFRFTDGRINLHDFERDKKRTRIKFNSKTGKAMFHIKRDSFLILHGGTFNQ